MGEERTKGYQSCHAASRAEWRAWLETNHAKVNGIWLISYKRATGRPYVPYDEAVEEALCFGWIDSQKKTLDDERSMQLYTPRRRNSPWSKSNKRRVERMIAAGLMTEAGLAKIEEAKRNGIWEISDGIEAMTMPADLEAALAANPAAGTTFRAFSPSQTKQLLWHVESAKRTETRAKRIAEIVAAAAEGWNPLNWDEKRARAQSRDGEADSS